MARMFGYGRASTDKQQITLKTQEEICINYFKLRSSMNENWEWAGWYPDAAITSRINWFERPMGQRIVGLAKRGDAIVVSNFDRAIRATRDCCDTLELIERMGFGLIILDVNLDTQTPMGRCIAAVLAAIKQLECDEIGRRTSEAIQYNLRMGKCHTIASPIGWTRSGPQATPYASVEDRNWAKEIVRLRDTKGLTFRQITEILIKKKAVTPLGHSWHARRVRLAYVAAKCGFPRLYTTDLPGIRELAAYQASHGGRSPQLQHGSVERGLLHTLPPMPDHQPNAAAPGAA